MLNSLLSNSWFTKDGISQWVMKNKLVAAVGAVCSYVIARRSIVYMYRKWKKYPPGPIDFPIIGSVLSLALYSDKFYINLANKYPKVSMYKLGTTTMVCINDIQLAKSVLSKKWAHDRNPHLHTKSYPLAFSDISGDEWSKRRAAFRRKVVIYDKDDEIKQILHRTMNDIDKSKLWYPRKTFVEFMFNLFFKILYGTNGFDDSMEEKKKKCFFRETVPKYIARAAVVIVLGMVSMSLGTFLREWIRYDLNMRILMVEMVKQWQEKYKTNRLPTEDVFTTFMAGTDTTGVTLDSCIIHLCKFPQIQTLIYKSMMKDKNDAILTAFIYELLRIMPAVPVGLPRYITENNIWIDGYYIPKGCMVHQNVVGMNRNEKLFKNANEFDIYRWLKRDEMDSKWIFDNEKRSNLASFSFGKRDCVGVLLAKKILNLVLKELIAKYEFSFDVGKDVEIKFGMDLTYHIQPEIGVRISERNSK